MRNGSQLHVWIGLVIALLLYQILEHNWRVFAFAFLMIYYWISQPIPIYLTALLPFIFLPFTEYLDYSDLALSFGNKMIFLFLGGFMLAIAIEKWHLHQYVARYVISFFGQSSVGLLGGFMAATAFLSMWISNTATALMMLPMVLGVFEAIPRSKAKRKLLVGVLLGVAFAANIGGTATIIGTPPNVQMAAILHDNFNISITFFEWLKIGFPFMLIMLLLAFYVLKLFFIPKEPLIFNLRKPIKLSVNQLNVLIVFGVTVFLWMTHPLISNWTGIPLDDTFIAIFGGLLLFVFPAGNSRRLLIWEDMKRIPWGILLLFGGGMALAKMLANAGVIKQLVHFITENSDMTFWMLLLMILALVLFATELMSNLALVSLVVPIIGEMAQVLNMPILYVCAGVALVASCAFMLPIATPPNAIIFSSNRITVRTMAKVGFILNIITLFVVYFWISFWMKF